MSARTDDAPVPSVDFDRFLIAIWGLGAGIPFLAKPRITLFDLASVAIVTVNFRRVLDRGAIRLTLSMAVFALCVGVSVVAGLSAPAAGVYRLLSVGLVLVDALAMFFVFRKPAPGEILNFLFYLSIGACLELLRPEDPQMLEQPVKFILNTPLGIIIAYALYQSGIPLRRLAVAAALGAYAIYCFKIGARNAGAVELIAILMAAAPVPRFLRRFTPGVYALLLVGALVAAAGLIEAYTLLALQGELGTATQRLTEVQSNYFNGAGGLLAGGRPQIYALFQGFLRSPWIGLGIDADVYEERLLLVVANIEPVRALYSDNYTILHSVVLGSAFELGVFAAAIWVYWLHLTVRALLRVYQTKPYGMEILFLLLTQNAWNLLFSPLVGVIRMSAAPALFLAAYIVYRDETAARERTAQ